MQSRFFIKLFFVLCIVLSSSAFGGDGGNDQPIREGVAVLTLYPEYALDIPQEGSKQSGLESLDNLMETINASWIERTFPNCLPPIPGGSDLTIIYTLYFPEEFSVASVCAEAALITEVEFAEPWYIDYLFLNHNDPLRNQQYGLNLIQANQAHDISTGSAEAIVAIVDTGVDWEHPDLRANMWINPNDDSHGWNFIDRNNNPMDNDGHGTHVAGIASAVTNNNTGVASIGYSCRIMAIKSGQGNSISYGYQGIEWAVQHGAHVVNCSWGGNGQNEYTRRVLRYARDNDVLVIGAAGNDNVETVFYPAGDPNVVSVASTDQNDRRSGFSNYGNWIDVCAPGSAILSTIPGGRYANLYGTSMASPFVAGLAVLIKAAYPQLGALGIAQLILDGADNIDDLNPGFRNRLGRGRINALRSLELGIRPVLVIEDLIIISDDNDNQRLDPGESVTLAVTLSNDENAEPTEEGVLVTLSTEDPTIVLHEYIREFPVIGNGDSFANLNSPFEIEIAADAIPHTTWLTVTVQAQPGNVNISKVYEVVVGKPEILIVDDDEGASHELRYFQSIEEMGYGWARWDVVKDYAPGFQVLTDYEMVIWFTGESLEPLDDLDRFQLEDALSTGANILLIGKYIGNDANNHQLLRTYFGAIHEEDSVFAMSVEGVPNRPIDEDVQLLLVGGEGGDARSSPSTMQPFAGADTLLVYRRYNDTQGVAAVYREDPRYGSKTSYWGFWFDVASNRSTPRSVLLEQIFRWFQGEWSTAEFKDNLAYSYSLETAYPNPFNATVTLRYSLPSNLPFSLDIFDMSGRLVTQIAQGETRGIFTAIWDASNYPSGTYFAKLNAQGFAPIERRLMLVK